MKKLILLLSIVIPFSSYAVSISHSVIYVDGDPAHQFEVIDPEFPPFYFDPDTETWPEEGYSYTWHTDEGHVSNEEKPIFYFAVSGPHEVHLTLTPRKKGDEDLKVFADFSFSVDFLTTSSRSNGDMTEVDMYVDGQAKTGDIVQIVVPLDPCRSGYEVHEYKVGFDTTKLKFLDILDQSNLSLTEVLPDVDIALGMPLNKAVNFIYNWGSTRDDVVAIIEFEVLAEVRESIALKFTRSVEAHCDKNTTLMFSPTGGPYDPNYKAADITEVNVFEKPAKKVNPTEVLYTIHFQNIGVAPVDSITIVDSLPPYLTFVSFEGSSESGLIVDTLHSGGTLTWIIAPSADIKGTNQSPTQPEPSTRGWVSFKAKISKETDINYDTCHCLYNIATIYFDDLSPIRTAANLIVIGDSLCFSPDPINQGKLYAQSICDYTPIDTNSSLERKLKPDVKKQKHSFIAYPNPFNETLQLKGELEKIQRIDILNSLGQIIKTLAGYNGPIRLDNQKRGLYFIRIYTEEGHHVLRTEKY